MNKTEADPRCFKIKRLGRLWKTSQEDVGEVHWGEEEELSYFLLRIVKIG